MIPGRLNGVGPSRSSSYTILRYPASHRRERLIKQTYSVFVSRFSGEVRKWHLSKFELSKDQVVMLKIPVAYFTENTLSSLHRICSHPLYPNLANVPGPPEKYRRARIVRARGRRHRSTPPADLTTGVSTAYRLQ
jgi:hypothetical protein